MNSAVEDRVQRKNKLILALLLLTPVLVMLAATITYKIGYVPDEKKNHGILLRPPLEIKHLSLSDLQDKTFDYVVANKEFGRWHLFIFGDEQCATKSCHDRLWLTRQLHVALAHRAHYVKRYYVAVGTKPSEQTFETLKQEHPRLGWLTTDSESYANFIGKFTDKEFDPIQNQQFILVDPNGWVMMYYTAANTGQDVIADLKYLLKKRGK